MSQYLTAAAGLLAAYVVYYLLSSFVSNRYHARKARDLGCQPAFERPYKYPLAVDLTYAVIQADKVQTVPDHFLQMYRETGRTTWIQNALGTMAYVTADPKNIQAILATQFQDFEIGSLRRSNFFPMLGNGIFTVDGKAW